MNERRGRGLVGDERSKATNLGRQSSMVAEFPGREAGLRADFCWEELQSVAADRRTEQQTAATKDQLKTNFSPKILSNLLGFSWWRSKPIKKINRGTEKGIRQIGNCRYRDNNYRRRACGRCDLMLFINHCGQLVKVRNDYEYYEEEVTSRYGFDKDRFGYFDLLEEVQKLGYTKGEKLYYRAYNSRKYVHMHNDEGVMEMLSKMEPGWHYVQVYVDSDVQQAADDNVCEDSTDEEYIVEESSESDGLSLDEIESCKLDALGQLSGEELDQLIDNFHEDNTNEEYVPEEESSESDGLNSSELMKNTLKQGEKELNPKKLQMKKLKISHYLLKRGGVPQMKVTSCL
ncbi:vacuolar sorting receptor [Striga asiatica]|uniref:Vacuolar sorting receptor n=1 Tax=Striga asiatica TaxID=4170 RepID=A0A5A7R9E5_STRAF|nr:vacuolar sorting receptor [Striga asiatica]